MAFLFKGTELVAQFMFELEERKDKYLLMQQFATEVDRTNADRILLIGESWFTAKPLAPFVYPSEVEEKQEQLHLYAASAEDENLILTATIIRHEDRISLDSTVLKIGAVSNMLAPVRTLWRTRR